MLPFHSDVGSIPSGSVVGVDPFHSPPSVRSTPDLMFRCDDHQKQYDRAWELIRSHYRPISRHPGVHYHSWRDLPCK